MRSFNCWFVMGELEEECSRQDVLNCRELSEYKHIVPKIGDIRYYIGLDIALNESKGVL